ncbi:MAG: ADP-ribosylglycohydrolase family protein, partial [Clostridia bacterium]
DDTNYTVLALTLLEQYGKSFTRLAWADHFVRNLPPDATYTAERVAYRNLLDLRLPPASATYRNPYRDWIGAQIRADLYGYVSPGDPLSAAHMAWTDASVTHTRNGIYGAMWVAATLAETYTYPPAQAVRRALCVLPPRARLTCALRDAMADFDQGMTYEQAAAKLRVTWEESNQHHWCHVISNAVIVLNALLYGENDLGKTLSMAVLPGFDTDCNGATAGSILGLWLGSARLPSAWKDPMRGALQVSLAGMDNPSFTALAQRTVKCVRLSPTRENE